MPPQALTRTAPPLETVSVPEAPKTPVCWGEATWSDAERETESWWPCWEALRRRRQVSLACALLGLAGGLALSLPQPPLYRAQAKLEITAGGDGPLEWNDRGTAASGAPSDAEIATQVEMLESRVVLAKVVDQLGLARRAEFAFPRGRLALWRQMAGFEGDGLTPRERAIEAAALRREVFSSRRSRVITITAEWPDAELAATFANALAGTYIEHNLETRWEAAQRTTSWLSGQLDQLRVKLEAASERLQNYARDSGLLYTSEQESVAEAKLQQLQLELSSAQAARIARQSSHELAVESRPETLPEVLDNAALSAYQQQWTDLRRQQAELAGTYTAEHVKVKRVRAQLAEIEAAMDRERERTLARMNNEYQAALRREKLLEAGYQQQSSFVAEQGQKAIQYEILEGEVETTRRLYDSLLEKVKQAGVSAAIRASNVRLVDPAEPPRRPSGPRHGVNAAVGLLLGLAGGMLFVLVGERADRTIKQPGDSMIYLRRTELGVIPHLRSVARRPERRVRLLAAAANSTSSAGTRLGSPSGPPVVPPDLIAWRDKPSLGAESFRATLTSILFAGNGRRPRVLVITSPHPGEGKTTVISNLAVSLAEINRRVLLVDADLRRPRVHEIFGMANTFGLSDVLQTGEPIEQVPLKASSLATAVPGLYVLPSGTRTANISSLLHSPRLDEFLERALDVFDTVLIDTPPVQQIADARVLGRLADGVVLVLRAGATTRGAARAAADRLAEDGIRVLGTVLNGWDPEANGSGYYDGYFYADRYSRDQSAAARA